MQVAVANGQQPVGKSLFASGKWVKVETSATGIHKVYYSWLKSIGFTHPELVKMFAGKNEEMPRWNNVSAQNSTSQLPTMAFHEAGGNDGFLFYVRGPVKWNLDQASGIYIRSLNQSARGKSWFFLTEEVGRDLSLPIANQATANPDFTTSGYDDIALWEEEKINLLESGNRWFTAMLSGGNVLTKTFQFPDRVEKDNVVLNLQAVGRSINSTGMEVALDGNVTGILHFDPVQQGSETDFATSDSLQVSRLLSGPDIAVSVKYNGSSADQGWLDRVSLQLRRALQYRGVPLVFRDGRTTGKGKTTEFQIAGASAGLQLWEVTNPSMPQQLNIQINKGSLVFRMTSDSLREFVLFDPQNTFPGVTKTEEVQNAEIFQSDVPEYLIMTPAAFSSQAERLAAFHRLSDGMNVKVVTVESVFNELSGGYPDISALRNFVRELYWQKNSNGISTFKYLLLFGKGTCDPVHDPGENNPNWIPTFQSDNSLNSVNSFVSDDFFGLLDPGEGYQQGNVDLGIGRIPAVTLAEATTAVDKIIHYHDVQTLGDWRNNITFVADDEDNNIHMNDSEKLSAMVHQRNPEYKTLKIYFDAYPQILTPEERYPEVTEAIQRSVQTGNLIVNYVGHASEDGLAAERVLTINDIDSWTNHDRLPLFVTATCEFSRWDMTIKRSAGEHLYFHPAGGAIALLSATRLVYSASNYEINKSFFNHAFDRDVQGKPLRLGDLVRLVKNENGGTVNTAKFCLLGDPALRLNYPENHCVNTEINQQPVAQFSGVLSPLTQVTIAGDIRDRTGLKMDSYSGTMSVQVLDQPIFLKTLGNGGLPPFDYQVQENILFNGSVSVKNGYYTYTFVLPKDVNFNKEAGLIRYYFNNGSTDGNGSFADIHFNGSDLQPVSDTKGPEIKLYLENESFREGAKVSANPLLMVYLNDASGINTTGTGIGHDMTMELDGQAESSTILNGFYRADAGTWKSGSVVYPLSTLSSGPHTLTYKVWDTANNSSSVIVHFYVDNNLVCNDIYNYPNPFMEATQFVIRHNRYDELFEVNLEILDINGQVVYSDRQTLASGGYVISGLFWKPLISYPVPAKGIYIYRISLTSQDGSHAMRSGRLIWGM